jgi:hypothetical protein
MEIGLPFFARIAEGIRVTRRLSQCLLSDQTGS